MFKFIHAADIHLDSPLKGLERYEGAPVDEIRGATRRALQNLVDLALEKEIDFVLISGDVYDGDWKDHNTGLFFVHQMSRLRAADIPVVVISGNHDAANRMTKSLPLPDNVEWLSHSRSASAKLKRLEDLGVAVHGQSFAAAAEQENLTEGYPERRKGFFNIGLLHTSLNGSAEHERYAPCEIDDLRRKEYDYWALGHIHHRQVRHEGPWIVYPGNLQGRQIRETGAKGCYLVTVDDQGAATLDFQPLDVIRWEICQVDATDVNRESELQDRLTSELTRIQELHRNLPLAVRVRVAGRCGLHDRFLSERAAWSQNIRASVLDFSHGHAWVEKVEFQTVAADLDATSLEEGPIGELLRMIDELCGSNEELLGLSGELDDLRKKLPDELVTGVDGLALNDPEQLRTLAQNVRPLLLNRLLKGSGA